MACSSCGGKSSWAGTPVKTTSQPQRISAKAPVPPAPLRTSRIKTFFKRTK